MYADLEIDDEAPLEFDQKNDHLQFSKDKAILKIINNEKFLFSDQIEKKNKFGFNQTRNFIITDTAIYNLKEKKLKRRFEISKLKGITVSVAKGSQDFIIHGVEQEHDYLYISNNKYIIIYILEKVFEKLRGKELDFIYTESSNINNRMTTKKEKKSNSKFSRMDDSELSDIKSFFKKLYYDNKGILKFDKNYDPFDDNETTPFLKIKEEQQNNGNAYQNDFNMNNYYTNKIPKARNFKNTIGGSFYQNFSGEKKSNENVAIDLENLGEEEIEEDEGGDDDIKIKSNELSDFNFICCIGKGKNSKTFIAKSEKYGVVYAIKISDKEKLLLNEAVESLKTEKKILSSFITNIKSIVQMTYCFQTFDKIFFVYPFYRGGDLLHHLENNGGNFRDHEDLLFFYICQLIIFLKRIHEGKIIYRNLKPENILLDDKGNIKITDFSKGKILTYDGERGLSLVGTPEYMPPEIILGKGQSTVVDYWMLGILIYDLYYGYTPFDDNNIERIYEKILYTNVNFDSAIKINEDLKNLIIGLLEKDDSKRLNDESIKNCDYFKHRIKEDNFWKKVENYEIQCPLKPKINEELQDDIQNFDTEFTNEKYDLEDIKSGDSLEYIKSAYSNGAFNYFN